MNGPGSGRAAARNVRVRIFGGRRRSVPRGERGFTLVELMIAVALIGIGTAFMTNLFINSYNLWKWNYDGLLTTRNARLAMATMTKALREAKPGTVIISSQGTPPGARMFCQIAFLDGRDQGWIFRQDGKRIAMVMPPPPGLTMGTTTYAGSDIEYLSFCYPSFQNAALIEVGIVARRVPYTRASPFEVQLTERVFLRNP